MNRVVLVSRRLGFRFWVFLISVWVDYVLGDNNSLMGGSDDAWSCGLLAFLDDQYHAVLSCVCAPWTWGLFYVFCALFHLPNVG